MADDAGACTPCPRCRGEMLRRLDEYECTGCGYFVSAAHLNREVAAEPSKVSRRITEAQLLRLEGEQPQRPVLYALDQTRPGFCIRWGKVIFLIVAFAETIAVNLVVRNANPNLSIDTAFIRVIIMVALVVAGVSALALYIDWAGFKKFAIGCAVAFIAYYGYHGWTIWQDITQELLIQLVLDALLMVWFIFILVFDIIRDR